MGSFFIKYIKNSIIIFFSIVLIAFLSYQYNFFHVTSTKWFVEHQLDSEQLILDGILYSNQNNEYSLGRYSRPNIENQHIISHKLFNESNRDGEFNKYLSQYGLQGRVFNFLYNNIYKSITFLQSLSSLAMSLVVGFLFLLIKRDFSYSGALVFAAVLLFSPWVVVFARNLYWVEALWFIPMVITMYYSKNIFTISKSKFIIMLLILYFAYLIKLLCGYEYISSIVFASFLPIVYQGLMQNIQKTRIVKYILVIGITSIFSFFTAILVHIDSIGTYEEGINTISTTIQKRLFKTENMNQVLNDVCKESSDKEKCIQTFKESLEANPLYVVSKYMMVNNFIPWIGSYSPNFTNKQKDCIKNVIHDNNLNNIQKFSLLYSYSINELDILSVVSIVIQKAINILAFFILILIYLIYFKKLAKTEKIFTLLLFIPPLSWFILAKGHSYIHFHMNYVLWYLPTVPYLILILYENYRKKSNASNPNS